MSKLAAKNCVPCRGGVPPLKGDELLQYHKELPLWRVVQEHHLARTFLFKDFRSSLDLANRIGEVAESEGHHPDLCVSWGKLAVTIHTHKINGLTESDFILAAKIDELAGPPMID